MNHSLLPLKLTTSMAFSTQRLCFASGTPMGGAFPSPQITALSLHRCLALLDCHEQSPGHPP